MESPTPRFDAPRPARMLLAILAALVMIAAACGDDDGDDAGVTIPGNGSEVTLPNGDDLDGDDLDGDDVASTVDSAVDEFQDQVEEGLEEVDPEDAQATVDELATRLRDNGATSLADLVERVEIAEVTGDDGFTLFAPNEEAFRALDREDFNALLQDPGRIIEVLESHVVTERLDAAELADLSSIEPVSGASLQVETSGDTVMVGETEVVRSDIRIGNGVIHVVDRVLTL